MRVFAIGLLAILYCGAVAASEVQDLSFRSWLDERNIGRHSFQIAAQGDTLEVQSKAQMELKVLFVPVFKYQHSAIETRWAYLCPVS